ncbi:MAG: DUF3108 domain-containing protein [Myxococcales bacterium]|nr:DUF3108 domain-containing protein [Myxococcales bacterium]
MTVASLALALLAGHAAAQPAPPPAKVPTDAECRPLPALKLPLSFSPGEVLEYDLDALGAQAGKLTLKVLPQKNGALPVEVHAVTNTFFSKVRRVKGGGTSYLSPRTLRPSRYVEDATENEVRKTADVTFRSKDHQVKVVYTIGGGRGETEYRYAHDGLDVVGTIYLMRQLPLKEGMEVCFDAYGIRRLWRVFGKVAAREHVSLPVGEFDTWHLSGQAVRLDDHRWRREIHVWITDDERRLPLVAVGAIDLGAVRATLNAFTRPGDKKARAEGKENLKW